MSSVSPSPVASTPHLILIQAKPAPAPSPSPPPATHHVESQHAPADKQPQPQPQQHHQQQQPASQHKNQKHNYPPIPNAIQADEYDECGHIKRPIPGLSRPSSMSPDVAKEESISRSYYSEDESSEDDSPRENRLLTFADEHGKSLVHICYYETHVHEHESSHAPSEQQLHACGKCAIM